MTEKIKYELGIHLHKSVIFLKFDYNAALLSEIKTLTGCKWSQSKKSWYVPDVIEYRKKFGLIRETVGTFSIQKQQPINQPHLKRFIETLQLKGYSPNTVRTYCSEFCQLLYHLNEIEVSSCNEEMIREYVLYCINVLRLTENTLHSRINSIKFFYEQVLHREKFFIEIHRPKKQSKLPKVIEVHDLRKMFDLTLNMKHNTMLKMIYGMGLRVSEIVNLKVNDVDSERMQVFIERAKGKKDRYANLPESLLNQLRNYYKEYRPKEYLFEGQYGGAMSSRSAQQIFKSAMFRAKITKDFGIHSLRHSFATHLLDNGTDIRFIQELLGHKDIKTTLIYANVSDKSIRKIKSPLDDL